MDNHTYSPDHPMLPLLKECARERDEAMRRIDQSHPMQRIAVNEEYISGLTWLVGKLVVERDAALEAKAAAAIGAAPRAEGSGT